MATSIEYCTIQSKPICCKTNWYSRTFSKVMTCLYVYSFLKLQEADHEPQRRESFLSDSALGKGLATTCLATSFQASSVKLNRFRQEFQKPNPPKDQHAFSLRIFPVTLNVCQEPFHGIPPWETLSLQLQDSRLH
jgi:hypothetical protein